MRKRRLKATDDAGKGRLIGMLFETADFKANVASHIGHFHRDRGDNCQDSYSLTSFKIQDSEWIIGVVCDGCGGADVETDAGTQPGRSEVGSALLASFIVRQIQIYVEGGMSICDTMNYLFDAIKRYISSTMWFIKPDEIAHYIQRYWLTTIRGVIMNDKAGCLFNTGDGISKVDYRSEFGGTFESVQHDVSPDYIGYACMPKPSDYGLSKKDVREAFDFHKFDVSDVHRIMLATDGFETHCERKLIATELSGTTLPRDLNGQQWNKKGKTGLKRWLNVCFDKGYFDDDIALLLVERKT